LDSYGLFNMEKYNQVNFRIIYDFMLPLVILGKPEMATLPLVQYVFQSQFATNYNLAFASYLLALLPIFIVYIFAQKWIRNGIVTGAVK
jgi:raffinose/stachyose/melibiose transport system permease protein